MTSVIPSISVDLRDKNKSSDLAENAFTRRLNLPANHLAYGFSALARVHYLDVP